MTDQETKRHGHGSNQGELEQMRQMDTSQNKSEEDENRLVDNVHCIVLQPHLYWHRQSRATW